MAVGLLSFAGAATAVDIRIKNLDAGTGQGLDDRTPATPVGGNPGKTRGEQARNVYEFAASLWGAVLRGRPIDVNATFGVAPLSSDDAPTVAPPCTANSGPLGEAFAVDAVVFTPDNVPAGAQAGIWYHSALAKALSDMPFDPAKPDIRLWINGAVGKPGCFDNSPWYFGIDGNTPPDQQNLLAVLMHEMAHGLGFSALDDEQTTRHKVDRQGVPHPDIFSFYIRDNATARRWHDMSEAERLQAARSEGRLVFTGPQMKAQAPLVLRYPRYALEITAPAAAAGDYIYGQLSSAPQIDGSNFRGQVVRANSGGNAQACAALDNAGEAAGHIVMVDGGGCLITVKARNAELAGATGVLIAGQGSATRVDSDNRETDAIKIPVVVVSDRDGKLLRANAAGLQLAVRVVRAGMDEAGNVQLYAPRVLEPGSSWQHFDDGRALPNLLMNHVTVWSLRSDITLDLTTALLQDEGWRLHQDNQLLRLCDTGVPTWLPGGWIIGANLAAAAKLLAGTSSSAGEYATAMRAHVSRLTSQRLILPEQSASLNACLSDAELAGQYASWRQGGSGDPQLIELDNGKTLTDQAGAAGSERLYLLTVPPGARSLNIRSFGGSGDLSLLVKVGNEPTASSFNYRSVHPGNSETVIAVRPAAGTYLIKLVGVRAYAGVSLQATYSM